MPLSTPLATMLHLLDARARGDVSSAVACYEPTAVVVLNPGQTAGGADVLKGFTEATMALPITFADRDIIEAGDVALHISHWVLGPAGGDAIVGRTTDVLRRQSDGRWLIVIDNPWGSAVLDRTTAS